MYKDKTIRTITCDHCSSVLDEGLVDHVTIPFYGLTVTNGSHNLQDETTKFYCNIFCYLKYLVHQPYYKICGTDSLRNKINNVFEPNECGDHT